MKKRSPPAKKPPAAVSDETAKLIADTAISIVNWIRATPARTAGALFVVGVVGAFIGTSTTSESRSTSDK